MVEKFKLKRLAAKISDYSIDNLDFFARIARTSEFTNIDECIEYLNYALFDRSMNPELSMDNGVLYSNIISDAICSIIHDLCRFIYNRDESYVAYIRDTVDEFNEILSNKILIIPEDSTVKKIFKAMIVLFDKVTIMANPTFSDEESDYGELALYYYNLMYTIYGSLNGTEKSYFDKMRDIYFCYLNDAYQPYAPIMNYN